VPERIGEPSTIEHVVYVIKENRTYDQVLGDVSRGNGDASLCVYASGLRQTNNRFVRDFVLLDKHVFAAGLSAPTAISGARLLLEPITWKSH